MRDNGPMVATGERGVTVSAHPDWPGWVFQLVPRPSGDRIIVGAISVIAPPGESITAEDFRRIPVGALLKYANPLEPLAAFVTGLVPDPERLRNASGSDEHLRAVAVVYRFAVGQAVAPRELIKEHFGVALTTVDRWLRKTRAAGLLGDYADERTGTPPTIKKARRS